MIHRRAAGTVLACCLPHKPVARVLARASTLAVLETLRTARSCAVRMRCLDEGMSLASLGILA